MLPDPFERGQQAAVSRYFKIMKHASLFFLKLWELQICVYFLFSNFSGLYYKLFMIVIYDCNAIGQYYKTTIVVKASLSSLVSLS